MSERMRVGELLFECVQRGSLQGGLTSEAVLAVADIIRKEIKFYDSPEHRQAKKWDRLVSENLSELCTALEKVWSNNPRGLRLHHISPDKTKFAKANAHAMVHAHREEVVAALEAIFSNPSF